MGKLAAERHSDLTYWFRQKYNLAPTDPRYLAMSDDDIALEYEMHLAAEGKELKKCFKCACTTHRENCPECGQEISGDEDLDRTFDKVEAGELTDPAALERALRGPNWQPETLDGATL